MDDTIFVNLEGQIISITVVSNLLGGDADAVAGAAFSLATELATRITPTSVSIEGAFLDGAGLYFGGPKVVGDQEAAIANATDAASAITQLNLVLAAMRSHGLIAT